MKKQIYFVIFTFLLMGCGDDPGAFKAGSKVFGTDLVMLEDVKDFSILEDCTKILKEKTAEYGINVDFEQYNKKEMSIVSGTDKNDVEYLNNCMKSKNNNYLLRIAKKEA